MTNKPTITQEEFDKKVSELVDKLWRVLLLESGENVEITVIEDNIATKLKQKYDIK